MQRIPYTANDPYSKVEGIALDPAEDQKTVPTTDLLDILTIGEEGVELGGEKMLVNTRFAELTDELETQAGLLDMGMEQVDMRAQSLAACKFLVEQLNTLTSLHSDAVLSELANKALSVIKVLKQKVHSLQSQTIYQSLSEETTNIRQDFDKRYLKGLVKALEELE